jgi:hypothetical protein
MLGVLLNPIELTDIEKIAAEAVDSRYKIHSEI